MVEKIFERFFDLGYRIFSLIYEMTIWTDKTLNLGIYDYLCETTDKN